jgi:uncharacterized membrane protein
MVYSSFDDDAPDHDASITVEGRQWCLMNEKILMVARGGVVAAMYVALSVIFQPISYGPVQIRVAEALTLLPYLWLDAVPGLFVGCLIANVYGGYGMLDVVLGSLATLAAAVLTKFAPNKILAALSPVAVNAVVVGGYLSFLVNIPLPLSVFYVGFGEAVACFALGIPLIGFLESRGFLLKKR